MAQIRSNVHVVNSRIAAVSSAVARVEGGGTASLGHFTSTNPNSQMQRAHTESKTLAMSFASALRRDLASVSSLGQSFADLDRQLGENSRS